MNWSYSTNCTSKQLADRLDRERACRAVQERERWLADHSTPEQSVLGFEAFSKRFLQAEESSGRLVELVPQTELHRTLVKELEALRQVRGKKLCYLAPRGSAKTTWTTFALPLWSACHQYEPFIILTADTSDQAESYLESIKDELLQNEELAEAYPSATGKGPIWRGNRIVLRNGVQMAAYGTGAKLRGRKAGASRPSLIIVDDPQNKDHIVSELQRRRSWEWITKDVLNAGSPDTNYVVAGTALHRECIVCKLDKTPGWTTQTFKAIQQWPTRMDLWKEWEGILLDWNAADRTEKALAFYRAHPEMDIGVSLLWPDREPLYQLMNHRAAIGTVAFESEKMNNPVDPSLCEWPEEYFTHAAFWFDEWPTDLACRTMAIDPSKGKDSHGDPSAIVKYGVSWSGVEYAECDMRLRTVDVICDEAAEQVRAFNPDGLYLEPVAFQELMAAPLRAALKVRGLETTIHLDIDNTAKEVRIRRLTEGLCQRKMRFRSRSPGTIDGVRQMQDFPNGEHDDMPDALEMARRLAMKLLRGRVK